MRINSEESLRQLYGQASGRSLQKQLSQLEKHSIHFLSLSPFAVLSTRAKDGSLDSSPRGGAAGFARVVSPNKIAIADARGNNRLDSLINIVQTGKVGCLFMIPGVDETLRINGSAYLSISDEDLQHTCGDKNPPKSVIIIEIKEVFLHCAKSMMRSKLWHPDSIQNREILPTMGKMIGDQVGDSSPVETQQAMINRYQDQL